MDHITHLRIENLAESPTNPRRNFPEAELLELADSITAQGVLQPIIVRALVDQTSRPETHEIVFGHRRFRASERAGLDTIPCIVRVMTDEQVALAQLTENAARQDVSALEEADAMLRLVDTLGTPVERLMEQTGKSRSHVYARLQLARSTEAVRRAVDAGMSPEIGVLIARLPRGIHETALARISVQSGGTESWMAFRAAREVLKRLTVPLSGNAWPLTWINEAATAETSRPCAECECNTSNVPGLQADFGSDVCTKPACHEARAADWIQFQVADARAKGLLIEGADAQEASRFAHPGTFYFGPFTSVKLPLKNLMSLAAQAQIARQDTIEQAICWLQAQDEHWVAPSVRVLHVDNMHGNWLVHVVSTDAGRELAREFFSSLGVSPSTDSPTPAPRAAAAAATTHEGGGGLEGLTVYDEEGSGARSAGLGLDDTRSDAEIAVSEYKRWGVIKKGLLRHVAQSDRARSREDLEVIAYALIVEAGVHEDVWEALGWRIDDDAEASTVEAQISLLSNDQIGKLIMVWALDWGTSATRDRARLCARMGFDPLNPDGQTPPAAGNDQSDEARCASPTATEDAAPVWPAPRPGRTVAYRNPATGETWSGRGVQPAWLRNALGNGRTLAEFAA